MKVFLYFQGQNLIRKSGIGRALLLQTKALKSAKVDITLDIRDNYDIAHVNTLWPKSHKIERFIKKQNILGVLGILLKFIPKELTKDIIKLLWYKIYNKIVVKNL